MKECQRHGHDVRLIETRLAVPVQATALSRVELVYECHTWACPNRLTPWTEAARDPEEALRVALQLRGMLAPASQVQYGATTASLDGILAGCPSGCLARQLSNPGMGLHDPDCPWLHRLSRRHDATPLPSAADARPYG